MLRQLLAAVRALLLATAVLGLAYPLLVTGFTQVAVPGRAPGRWSRPPTAPSSGPR